jgi:hypothetical protein
MNERAVSNLKSQRRWILVITLVVAVAVCAITLFSTRAASPAAGTITPSTVTPLTWTGTGSGIPPTGGGEDSCEEGTNCDTFILTISGVPADWANKRVHIQINWGLNSSDYDMYVHKGSPTGPIVATSGAGGTVQEQVDLNPLCSSSIGTGDFYVHVVYFAATQADQYHGTASVVAAPACAGIAPQGTGVAPRYENYTPPAAGPNTLGRGSGEPSIGVGLGITGHPEGRAMFQSDVQTLRVTFNAACATPRAVWENKPAPTSQEDFDPILFTDHQTGRTIVSLLDFVANPAVGEMSYTDTATPFNDGDIWTPSQGTGIGSGIDHQTAGGGPYHLDPITGLPPPHSPTYPNAVYYCAQALIDASCARSDDGGLTFGPSVVAYQEATATSCGGLHGHIKVAPDGTVYLPNKDCNGEQGVVVSEDNGINWSIRHIPNSSAAGSDPSVGVGSGGRVYFGYADGDTKPVIAMSNDRGLTWSQSLDVGASLGINNVVFPAVVAGDNNRAAFAFLGTTTAGGLQGPRFTGIWHLYIAHTYDGGASWITVDATPNDAVQRGCIWLGGGSNICRNLLDFMDVTVDQQGRVVVGYADGSAGGEAVQAAPSATGNSYTALAAIARQSGGRRLFAAFDPPSAPTVPGTPFVTTERNGSVVHLSWSEADNGGSPITMYKIFRGAASGVETLLTAVPATPSRYDDNTAVNPATTYFYKVTAVNAQGESCGNNEVSARFVGDSCTGFMVSEDPTDDQTGAPVNADLDVQSLSVSEPSTGANAGKLVFKLKVADLTIVPNERMWRTIWNSPFSPGGQYYVGMTKDQAGAVTFEYGTVATAVVGLVLGVPTTTKVGTPDDGSFTTDGVITIVVSRDKVGNPQTGDLLGAFSTRTYATVTDQIRSTNAIDLTTNANANDNTANAATYLIVNPSCALPTPTPTPTPNPLPCSGTAIEDDDSHISYSNGWHAINNAGAYAGHYRLNEGGNNQHNVVLTFDTPATQTGTITYFYAISQKGGSAEVFLDHADMGPVYYNGTSGSNRSPIFGASKIYNYGMTANGQHTLEIRPIHDGVYIDGFCIGNATPTGTPAAHPGNTSESLATQSAGQALLNSITLPAGTQAISIAAESSIAVPIQLVLINPSGTVVQTVNSSSGVAILEAPITQSGVYIIKTVNLSLGPVQIWSVATPLVSTSLVAQMSNGPTAGPREGTSQGGPLSPLLSKILFEVYERMLASYI